MKLHYSKTNFTSKPLKYLKQRGKLNICMSIFDTGNITFFCSYFSCKLLLRHARFQTLRF